MGTGTDENMNVTMENTTNDTQEAVQPLVVKNINKQYKGGIKANTDISLSIRPGEIMGILGPNGAGKTTLVRQITTELTPTTGSIRVFGIDVVAEPIRAKNVMGIVPQEAELYESLSVKQTLRIFGKLRGLNGKEANRRAEELISDLRLGEHRNVVGMKLSGGLKRRVMVGLAALGNPKLIVMDEPATGLDPQSRRDLWALLREYKERGATILLTTHYMEEAESLCDRVGIIQNGRLLALDTVPNLKAAHGYEFKITYSTNGDDNKTQTIYGKSDQELVEQVQAKGIRQFSVARTSLEDVYLALTDEEEPIGDSDQR
ncbi:MAG: ABC transporter ATP-binding protein [SAR202 cluster bacterium]|nr:ABC transporter ATP-binding protein [SAR202 cluster bacterium]